MATKTDSTAQAMLSMSNLCEAVGMSRCTITKLIREGKIPAYRTSTRGHYRFNKDEVLKALEVKEEN